jgi:hypothetical protein
MTVTDLRSGPASHVAQLISLVAQLDRASASGAPHRRQWTLARARLREIASQVDELEPLSASAIFGTV